MIIEFQPDIEKIEKEYNPEDAKKVLSFFETTEEFNIPTYTSHIRSWNNFSKNCTSIDVVAWFYGLNVESLEKFINENYGETNPNKFLVGVHLLSMDYEKYYKYGTFIDLDGKDTEEDFYSVNGWEDLIDKAQFDNYWIAVELYMCDYGK